MSEVVTAGLVGEVLAECGLPVGAQVPLPMEFMVNFVLGLAVFSGCSYQDVIEHMIGGFPQLGVSVPNKSNLTRARGRLGARVMRRIFEKVAGALAPVGQDAAFFRGMRTAAVDGMLFDAAESSANRARFGGQNQAEGVPRGLPVVRLVTLTETGTHAQVAARLGGWHDSEVKLARPLAEAASGMLVVIDRLYPDVKLWRSFLAAGAHVVVRASGQIATVPEQVLDDGTYLTRMRESGYKGNTARCVTVRVIEYTVGAQQVRLLTSLLDPVEYPAGEVAALYPERWEAEGANRQIKSFQRGDRFTLRSKDPELVEQEIWAHLIVHTVITRVITAVATTQGLDPDRLSYTKVLTQLRLAVTRQPCPDPDGQPVPGEPGRFVTAMSQRARRLLDNGTKRLRESARQVSKHQRKYPPRPNSDKSSPRTRKTTPKTITLTPTPILA